MTITLSGGNYGGWTHDVGDLNITNGVDDVPALQVIDVLHVTSPESTVWKYRMSDGVFVGTM